MPTNILLVEREKEIKENRIANNMRQEVIAAKSQVFSGLSAATLALVSPVDEVE